jgi:hypothetical protein
MRAPAVLLLSGVPISTKDAWVHGSMYAGGQGATCLKPAILCVCVCVCVCVCARACSNLNVTFPPHPSTLIRARARAHARVRALAGINISTHELARERVTSIHLRVSDVYTRTLKEVLILSSQFLEASVFTNLLEQFQKQCLSRVPADFAVVGRVP